MRTYTEVFRAPEFTSLFVGSSLQVAASTVSGLALGTYVYAVTGAPLLAALAMFGPSLAQLIGATALLSAADRLPPRATMTFLAFAYGLGTAAQAIPGMPIAAIFAIALVLGALNALGGGVRYGLLIEILPAEGYLLGRSVLNMAVGIFQITGFALGGVLVTALSPRGTLLAGSALYLASAAAARWGLRYRPPRASGRPSVAQTMRTNRLLWSSVPRRYVYLGLWVPNGLIVGCEALYVSYSPRHAGTLFAFAALGMLAGDILGGRFIPPGLRDRLGPPLRLLLAAPYLIFVLHPALPLAEIAVAFASVGYSATLLLQQRLMALTPDELSGHALGLHSSGMLAMQGVGAAIAGAIAQQTSPAAAMTVMAAASVGVTLLLAPGLRSPGGRLSRDRRAPDEVAPRTMRGEQPRPHSCACQVRRVTPYRVMTARLARAMLVHRAEAAGSAITSRQTVTEERVSGAVPPRQTAGIARTGRARKTIKPRSERRTRGPPGPAARRAAVISARQAWRCLVRGRRPVNGDV